MAEAKEEAKVTAEEVPSTAAVIGEEEKVEAAAPTETGDAEAAAEPEEESPFYKEALKPQMTITRFRPGRASGRPGRGSGRLNSFIDRARRMLRAYQTIQIHGVESGMATACTLVEILKREKIAVIDSVNTNVNLTPRFNDSNAYFGSSFMSIDFVLSRGENAQYITDMKQRRLIAIFEKFDTEHTGLLPKATVEGLDMGDTFYSTDEQKANAAAFLKGIGGDDVSMPDFIKYASALIDDTLRGRVFTARAAEKYGIPVPQSARQQQQQQQTSQ